MNTAFILMAQYNGRAIIPLDQVCKDYFTHLTTEMFQRKVLAGQIKIPITRLEPSQKSAKGIHITDLAATSTYNGKRQSRNATSSMA